MDFASNVCVMNHVMSTCYEYVMNTCYEYVMNTCMVIDQMKIVFSMELEIAFQSGVHKRGHNNKKITIHKNLTFE